MAWYSGDELPDSLSWLPDAWNELVARIAELEDANMQLKADVADAVRLLKQAEAERDRAREEVHRIRMCYPGGEGEELLTDCEMDRDKALAELAKWKWIATHEVGRDIKAEIRDRERDAEQVGALVRYWAERGTE